MLDFASVVPDTVPNFSGDLKAYSAIWTNLSGIIITNPPADENSEETYTTNVVEYFYHVLLVDGAQRVGAKRFENHDALHYSRFGFNRTGGGCIGNALRINHFTWIHQVYLLMGIFF